MATWPLRSAIVHQLEVKRQMEEDDISAITELLDMAAKADGHRPLGEHQWIDLVHGGRAGFAGLVAWEPGHDHPVGYAQVSKGTSSWALEFVVSPHHREETTIGHDLVAAALDIVAREGGGHVHMWVSKPSPMHGDLAASLGLQQGRDLLQMRRSLPAGESSLDTRPFVSGQDEEAWLDVNNRAFHWHPEQGGWDIATLKAREAEAWFDAEGFLLHERDGRLAAFCWTKEHRDTEPNLGEIYVIAVDPDFHGQGLGRDMVLAGLDHLTTKGLPIAMLYVDADNTSAVRLYDKLGFTVDHVDRAFVGDIAAL